MAGRRDNGDRLQVQTLIIAALASATAALVVSQFWKGGTVMSAAITPVIVAIVSDLLHRPARTVQRFTSTSSPPPTRRREPSTAGLERLGGEVASAPSGASPPPHGPRQGAMRVYKPSPPRGRLHLKVALVTGLLGFVIAAAVLTLPELIGGSALGGDRKTTLFGGGDNGSETAPADDERQTTTEEHEEQPEETQPQETAPQETTPQQPAPDGQTPPAQTTPQPTTPAPSPEPAPPQSQPAP
jgi:hypothetical protein